MNVKRPVVAIASLTILGVLLRLPFLSSPVGADEGGFLLIAQQWGEGASLYGDYWVDRPPLLIAIFALAGDVTGLRLLGCVAVAITIAAVGCAGWVAGGARAARWSAAAATLFCSAPWFGVVRVNGELLAAPFVAVGIMLTLWAVLRAESTRARFAAAAGAGLAGGCSALIKQSTLDVFVFAVVLLVAITWSAPDRRRAMASVAVGGTIGTALALAIVLWPAARLGTGVSAMFEATVGFRLDAGQTIRAAASSATTDRLETLLATWAVSGLSLIGLLTLIHVVRPLVTRPPRVGRRADPVLVATLATIVYASFIAVGGGSYWAHYLIQLIVPTSLAAGLLASTATTRLGKRLVAAAATLVVVANGTNLGGKLATGDHAGARGEVVGNALAEMSHPSDTAVVAFGQPHVLWNAGLSSPYVYLWSLPVRTRDGDLSDLAEVLAGPERPTWFVDWSGLDVWGIDSTLLRHELAQHYRVVTTVCGRTIWLDRTVEREATSRAGCS